MRSLQHLLLLVAALVLPHGAHAGFMTTVDWNVVPRGRVPLSYQEPTPYYACDGDRYADRRCQYLWQSGMELGALNVSFYDDKWVDGNGLGVPEGSLGAPFFGAYQVIEPRCETGLAPCFNDFTPTRLDISGFSNLAPQPYLFIQSSRGALLKLPSAGRESVTLSGHGWKHLDWIAVGFYLPADCAGPDPADRRSCSTGTEKAYLIDRLAFKVVPEPGTVSLLLLGLGLLRCHGQRSRTLRTAAACPP